MNKTRTLLIFLFAGIFIYSVKMMKSEMKKNVKSNPLVNLEGDSIPSQEKLKPSSKAKATNQSITTLAKRSQALTEAQKIQRDEIKKEYFYSFKTPTKQSNKEQKYSFEAKERFAFSSSFREISDEAVSKVLECVPSLKEKDQRSLQSIMNKLVTDLKASSENVEEDLLFENIHYSDDDGHQRILALRFENNGFDKSSALTISHLVHRDDSDLPDILRVPELLYNEEGRKDYLNGIKNTFGYSLHEIEYQYFIPHKQKTLALYKNGEVERIDHYNMQNKKRLNCVFNNESQKTQCSCL